MILKCKQLSKKKLPLTPITSRIDTLRRFSLKLMEFVAQDDQTKSRGANRNSQISHKRIYEIKCRWLGKIFIAADRLTPNKTLFLYFNDNWCGQLFISLKIRSNEFLRGPAKILSNHRHILQAINYSIILRTCLTFNEKGTLLSHSNIYLLSYNLYKTISTNHKSYGARSEVHSGSSSEQKRGRSGTSRAPPKKREGTRGRHHSSARATASVIFFLLSSDFSCIVN